MAITGQTKPVQNLQRAFPQELAVDVARSWQQRADQARQVANKTLAGLSDVSHIGTPEENEFVQQKVSEVEGKLEDMARQGFTHKDMPDVQSLALEVQNDSDLQRIRQNKAQFDAFKERLQETDMPQWRRNAIIQKEKERFRSSAENDFTPRTYGAYSDPNQIADDYVDQNNLAETQKKKLKKTFITEEDGEKKTESREGVYEVPKLNQSEMQNQILSSLATDEQLNRQLYDDYTMLPEEQKEQYDSASQYAQQRMQEIAANKTSQIQNRYYNIQDEQEVRDSLSREYQQLDAKRQSAYGSEENYIQNKLAQRPYQRVNRGGRNILYSPKRTSLTRSEKYEPIDTEGSDASDGMKTGDRLMGTLSGMDRVQKTGAQGLRSGLTDEETGFDVLANAITDYNQSKSETRNIRYNGNNWQVNIAGKGWKSVQGPRATQIEQTARRASLREQEVDNLINRTNRYLEHTAPFIGINKESEDPIRVDLSRLNQETFQDMTGVEEAGDEEIGGETVDTVNGIQIRKIAANRRRPSAPVGKVISTDDQNSESESASFIAYNPDKRTYMNLGSATGPKQALKNTVKDFGKEQINTALADVAEPKAPTMFEYTPSGTADEQEAQREELQQILSSTELINANRADAESTVRVVPTVSETGDEFDPDADDSEVKARGAVVLNDGTKGIKFAQFKGDDETPVGEFIVTAPNVQEALESNVASNQERFNDMVYEAFPRNPITSAKSTEQGYDIPEDQVTLPREMLSSEGFNQPYRVKTGEGQEYRRLADVTFRPGINGLNYSYTYEVLDEEGNVIGRDSVENQSTTSDSPYHIIYNEIAQGNF